MKSVKYFKTSILLLVITFILTGSALAAGPELEWATYYGTNSNFQDAAEAVTVAPDGSIVAVGFALSLFPESPWFRVDAFIAQFSSDGTTLLNEMILEGSPINGAFGVSVDDSGIITVAGQTYSSDFPVTADALQATLGGSGDGFLLQLSPDFEIIYGTYLGGSGEESIVDMAVDKKGGFVLCGYTESEDFPVTDGAFQDTSGGGFDAFVSRIVPGGETQLTYSTYLGGSGDDCDGNVQDERLLRQAVATTPSGNIVVAGMTWSEDFPVTDGALQTEHSDSGEDADMYVTVLNPTGENQLVYSTLLGGPGRDVAEDLVVRDDEKVHLLGLSRSADFPVTANAYQDGLLGWQDAVVVQLKALTNIPPNDQLMYSTYFGGSLGGQAGKEGRDAGNGIYMLKTGDIVISGVAGSTDFPTTDGSTLQGDNDIFITRLDTSKKPEKQLVSSILFGGSGAETLSVGPVNDGFTTVCIAGATRSPDLPGVEGSYDDTFSGTNLDAFVAKYNLGSMGYPGDSN
ncbi:MAG: hypothetical protein ACYSUB_21275 [Planctomycetota bacterium]|jgi:hypothetical protein